MFDFEKLEKLVTSYGRYIDRIETNTQWRAEPEHDDIWEQTCVDQLNLCEHLYSKHRNECVAAGYLLPETDDIL